MAREQIDVELTNAFLGRALLTVLRLARKQDSPRSPGMDAALGELQKALSRNDGLEGLEKAMERVKNEVIKAELGGGRDTAGPVVAGRDSLESNVDFVEEIRSVYLNILAGLEIELGAEPLKNVTPLRKKIESAQSIEEIREVRPELEDAVRKFAHQVFDERKRAAAFISEVARQLDELEKNLFSSVEYFQKNFRTNYDFQNRLSSEVNQIIVSVRDSQQIEKLKNMVLNRLSFIGEALKKKQNKDKEAMVIAGRDLGGVKKKFGDVQDEIKRIQDENQVLMQKLRFDWLTGALNRLAFDEQIALEMSRFSRYKRPFSLIIFDLDYFKDINDGYGHSIGDKCLQAVVENIKPLLRGNDFLARFGGDEFVVLLPETGKAAGREVAEKIRQAIETTDYTVRGKKVPLTISSGVAEAQEDDASVEMLINRADKALYQAKAIGRNQVFAL
ncbi:MAG: diguanylate cyclase [Pseudomonadota bacterium]